MYENCSLPQNKVALFVTSIEYPRDFPYVFGSSLRAIILLAFEMLDFFDQRYYRLNKLYMSQMGVWPEQSLFLRIILPVLVVATLVSVIIPEIIRIVDVRRDVDRVIEGIIPILVMIATLIKLLNCCFNVEKMRKIIQRISHDWGYLNDAPSAEILHKYASRGRFVTVAYSRNSGICFNYISSKALLIYLSMRRRVIQIVIIYLVYIYGSMSLYLILPVIPSILDVLMPLNETRPKKALYEAEYGVDPDEYFFEILIHSYVTTVVTIAILVTVDTMYFVSVQHACALFNVIRTNLKLSFKEFSSDVCNFKTICYCINIHKDALSFADLLESTYSTAFGGIVFLYLMALSIAGVLTLIKIGQIDEMLRFGSFTLAVAFSLYLNSVPGQNLIDHSLDVHIIAYDFDWYKLPTKDQKLLGLMMLRSIKPCVLTGGKIYVISMESYSSVIQTAMSYFTVLSSMR